MLIFDVWGHSLHFRTDSRKPGTAYLMFPHENIIFRVSSSIVSSTKCLKSNVFSFSVSPKIEELPFKIVLTIEKIRLLSKSTKNHTQYTNIHFVNYQSHCQKITQNTSKINTFSLRSTNKTISFYRSHIFLLSTTYQKFISAHL